MDIVEFQNIKKTFGGKEVLKDISFKVKKGEILGLVAESSGGKSTLFNILVGLYGSDEGEIFFNENILRNYKEFRSKCGFATQKNLLLEELTLKENAVYFGSLYGLDARESLENFHALINFFDLEFFEDFQVRHLSGGTSKRANLLISVIHRPHLLILDEPTTGLDSLLRSKLWKYIKQINESGTTILVSSHLLDEIEENCHRIAILKKGVIFSLASVERYRSEYQIKEFRDIFKKIIEE